MKDQIGVDAICLVIQHCQMFTHHHKTRVKEVVEPYCQVHGFNDDSH